MKRALTILTVLSVTTFCPLVVIWPASYCMNLSRYVGTRKPSDSVPVTQQYRLGFERGAMWLYTYEMPYRGSIMGINNPNNPPIRWSWYWEDYGFSQEIQVGYMSSWSCDLPGIYFRRFSRFDGNPPWTTLRMSLWYPALLSTAPLLLWVFRNRRRLTTRERTQKFTNFIYIFSPFLLGTLCLAVSILCYFGLRHMCKDFDEHSSLPNYQVGILLHLLRLMFLLLFPAAGCYLLLVGIWMRRLIKQKHERTGSKIAAANPDFESGL